MSKTTHGNVITDTGTCEVCGREGVGLHRSRNEDRKLKRRLLICADEFACFAAWQVHRR